MDEYTYEEYNRKALNYFEQEMYGEALIYFDLLIDFDYMNKVLWALKGYSHEGIGDFQKALECFDRCIHIDPMDEDAWFHKGNILRSLGSFKGAIKCFDKVLEINPTHIMALNLKGIALSSIGKYKEAIESYDEALDLDPLNEIIRENKQGALNSLENEYIDQNHLKGDLSCPKCGFNNIRNASFCQSCGNNMNPEIIIDLNCPYCGFGNNNGSKFCSGCGKKLEEEQEVKICFSCGSKNKAVATFCQVCGKSIQVKSVSNSKELIVDVNHDSEDKIAAIPSIGPILAKKAIYIRDSKGGFDSVEDFCALMELKPHISKKMESLIMCNAIEKIEKPKGNEPSRRIVDF